MTESDVLVTNEIRSCLQELLYKLEIRNYAIDISAGTVKGDNFLGVIVKAGVKGQDEDGRKVVRNFIVKTAPRNEHYRTFAPIRVAYDREIFIYSKVLPAFKRFQNDRGVKEPFKSYAKYYQSSMEDMNEALIMDDMKEYGFKMHSRYQPMDYHHTLLVLKEYGKFHALSFALRDQDPKQFNALAENAQENFYNGRNNKEFLNCFHQQTMKALNALDPIKHRVAYEKFRKFQENTADLIISAVKSDLTDPHSVIGHGDCWINNFLFKYNENKKRPSEICILDWQLARVGSPALDLGYFIFTCTSKELRDEHYDSLIRQYYDSFSSFVRALGSDPNKLYPFDVLLEDLKKYSAYGLYMAVLVLLIIISDIDEIPDIRKSNDDRLFEKRKNVETYNARIRGIVLDFVRLGYNF